MELSYIYMISLGCSWTRNWLEFDNSYYRRIFEDLSNNSTYNSSINISNSNSSDSNASNNLNAITSLNLSNNPELLWLPTDQALLDAAELRQYFILYARDQEAFFKDYIQAHVKMSELGARFLWNVSIEIET